jgi:phosphoglycolate phosphatase
MALLVAGGLDPQTGKFRSGSVIGAGTTEMIAALWHADLGPEEQAARVVELDRAFHAHGLAHSVPFADVAETLAELSAAGFVLGVATNDGEAATHAALGSTGLDRYFAHVFGYDSVASAKPAPDMVHAFCAASGLAPQEVVVVGDNAHDMAMARAAGAGLAIGVTTGNSSAADLMPIADAVLDRLGALPGWLHQNRK